MSKEQDYEKILKDSTKTLQNGSQTIGKMLHISEELKESGINSIQILESQHGRIDNTYRTIDLIDDKVITSKNTIRKMNRNDIIAIVSMLLIILLLMLSIITIIGILIWRIYEKYKPPTPQKS